MMGQSKEPRGKATSSPWMSHSLGTGKPNQTAAHTPPHSAPAPFLSLLQPPLFQVSSVTLCWVLPPSTQPTWSPTVGAKAYRQLCKIGTNLCSLDPSLLLVSRSLHLGLAPASGGWIFTLCLWALPQEVPVLCGSCSAMFDPSLTQVHVALPRLFSPLSVQPSALHAAGCQLCSWGFTPMFAQCWGTSASLRIKLISLGLELCFDLSEWSWATTGQHGQCLWHTPRLTVPYGGAWGVSSNSTELPGLVPSLPLVSALKKKTDVLVLGNDKTENPANFQFLPRINVSLTEIFFPLDLP